MKIVVITALNPVITKKRLNRFSAEITMNANKHMNCDK